MSSANQWWPLGLDVEDLRSSSNNWVVPLHDLSWMLLLTLTLFVIAVCIATVSCLGLVLNTSLSSSSVGMLLSYLLTMSSLTMVAAMFVGSSTLALALDFSRTKFSIS